MPVDDDHGADGAQWQGAGRSLVHQFRHRKNIEEIFDDYADEFEDHLVNTLEYGIPGFLRRRFDTLEGLQARQFNRCLDLGCGTGLVGRTFRDCVTERLEGVDLSAPMLAKAEESGGYDALHQNDLITHLKRQQPGSYDLILAADVVCYLYTVEPFFKEVRRVLAPGGLLGFSTESANEEEAPRGVLERESERFAHSRSFITRSIAGFEVLLVESTMVRLEDDAPLLGDIFFLRRLDVCA
eukprot:NODE_16195_length_1007_cov_3.834091.p2 GENE.NODE_16195_length_1007_cov_3.834091~~NODE_16195_length_1007_cov_3.834091.p2  ORF type:complete len:240 (+),score=85.01 NODE_16195_length_1007_cov_3.834091:52-771(+)